MPGRARNLEQQFSEGIRQMSKEQQAERLPLRFIPINVNRKLGTLGWVHYMRLIPWDRNEFGLVRIQLHSAIMLSTGRMTEYRCPGQGCRQCAEMAPLDKMETYLCTLRSSGKAGPDHLADLRALRSVSPLRRCALPYYLFNMVQVLHANKKSQQALLPQWMRAAARSFERDLLTGYMFEPRVLGGQPTATAREGRNLFDPEHGRLVLLNTLGARHYQWRVGERFPINWEAMQFDPHWAARLVDVRQKYPLLSHEQISAKYKLRKMPPVLAKLVFKYERVCNLGVTEEQRRRYPPAGSPRGEETSDDA